MSYEEELLERARQQGLIDRGSRSAPTPPPPKLVGTVPQSPSAYNSPQNQQTAQDLISGDFTKTDQYTGAQEGEKGFVERSVNFGASLMASVFDFSDSVEDVQKKGVVSSFVNNPIENTFDFTVAYPLMKLYERVNQTGSYLGALAPGGIDPISFTEAGTISPGQVAALNVNVARDNIRNRRGNYAADIANILLTGMSPGGMMPIGVSLADQYGGDGDGLYLPEEFRNNPERFLNEAEKNNVFGQGQARMASGSYDFAWALVVDPLIFVPIGKVTKFARLRFIDQDTRKVGTGLADDPTEEIVSEIKEYATEQGDRVARETAALEAREGRPATYEEVMEIAGAQVSVDGKGGLLPASLLALAGSKLGPAMQQFNRMVYGNSNEYARSLEMGSNEEALWGFLRAIVSDKTSSVFSNYTDAQRYQAALLLWRAQWIGDMDAAKAFTDAFPGLASIALSNASFVRSRRFLPENAPIFNAVDEQFEVFAKDGEEAIAALQRFPDSGNPGYQVALEDLRDIIESSMQLTANGDLVYNAAQMAAANRLLKQINEGGAARTIIDNAAERTRQSPEYKALDQDVADQKAAAEEMITEGQLQAIQFAAKSVGEMRIYENLTEVNTRLFGGGSTEFKMGRNNKLGRWNQQRRYINESKTASIQPLVGLGPVDLLKTIRHPAAASTLVPFYTMNGTQNFVRLWRLPGRERPAGNVDLEGIGAVGNLREIQAMIYSTRAFTGAARVDPTTGVAYGGRERGEALLNQFIEQTGRANNNPAQASEILKELESKLAKEVFRYTELGAAKASKSGKVYDRILKEIYKKGNQDPQAIKIREALANQGIQAWAEKSPTSVVVDDNTLDLILDYAQAVFNRGRDKTMAQAAQNRIMFIDSNGQLNHIPLGENQTANTMQLMNLRYFEQQLGQTNLARKSFGAIDSFLQAFNIAWRPAVLFRLGYPIRNVGEGQVRAIAYQQSMRPVVEMFQAAGQSVGDLVLARAGSRSGKRQVKRAEKKKQKLIASYKKRIEENPEYGKEARGWIGRDPRLAKDIERQEGMQMNRMNNASNALDVALDDFARFLDEEGLDPESARTLLNDLYNQLENIDTSIEALGPDYLYGPIMPAVKSTRLTRAEAEATGRMDEFRQQAIDDPEIYAALTAPDPNAPKVKQGDWILENIEEAGIDISPDEVRPSKILPSKGNKPLSDLDIKFIKHGVVSKEWLNQLENEKGVEQMLAWLYTGLLDNGSAQGGGNVPIPTPAGRLDTRGPDGVMRPDKSVKGMPEEWFATGTEFIKTGRGKTQEMIVVPWAKAMIERQKDRVAKPGELSNEQLSQVEFAIRNGNLDDRIDEIVGMPDSPVSVSPSADLTARVQRLSNLEQSRQTITDTQKGVDAIADDSLMPVRLTEPGGSPFPEENLPPVPGGGTYPDFVTKERSTRMVTTQLDMKWNGMDPDMRVVSEFNRRLANIRSSLRELRDASERWAQLQDPAVAVEIVAAQRVLKAAERHREMMQDMGVAAVPTLLARGEGADPFNPNSVLAAPASSAASAATTTRSRLTADSEFSQMGWRELENQRYTVINIEDLRRQGYPVELMEEYWAGNAEQLRLLSTNYFGRAVMEAETEVVNGQLVFTEAALADLLKLFETPKGKDNWEVIAWTRPPDGVDKNYPAGIRRPFQQRGMRPSADEEPWMPVRGSLEDLNNQEQYLNFLLHHLEVLTPGVGFREAIRAGKVPGLLGDKANKNLIESVKEYNGKEPQNLQTIIGDRLLAGGDKGMLKAIGDKWRSGVNVGFNWIGTLPENALLRMPFYRAEYERVYGRTIALMESTMGSRSMLTGEEIGRAAFAAHKEAIRGTRKYLYTIQRRTWLGDSFETTIPFISAGQNAAQAVGRMTMNDPTVATVGAYYWARGWEEGGIINDQGEIELPWLEPLLPSWLKDAGINSISLNVGSLNVMFPDSGFGPFFRPGPVVGIPASLMMKHGLLLSPSTPGLMTRLLGQDKADPAWAAVNKWLFADAGPMPDAIKATLPSWMQKWYDLLRGDGESAAYTAMVSAIARSEMLRVSAGAYEGEEPTMQEIWDDARTKTNMMYGVIKPLVNVLSPTAIQMNSELRPLVEEYRHYREVYGFDADRKFIAQYGEIMLMLADSNRSQNVAGVDVEAASVRRAKKYSGLTKEIANAGVLNSNPRLLGVILNDPTPDKEYDFNIGALRWLQTKTIPGTSKSYRELLSSQESMTESSTSAGWSYWLMFVDDLNVVAQQRGLADYKRAPDLEELAEQMKAKMAANPLYAGWWESYGLQERETKSTIKLMRIMTNPDSAAAMEFVEDPNNAQLVNGMIEYLSLRDRAQATILQVEKGITAGDNEMIQKAWLDGVSQIVNRNPVFQEFYERYLFSDREAAMKDQVPYEGGLLGSDRQLPDVGELRVNPETGEREWVE